jgi:hypothetical protein
MMEQGTDTEDNGGGADDRVILYPAGGRFNRLRREQHFLNELLTSSFEGWELVQNILSKIPGGIWVFDRELEVPVRTNAKDVENRILQVCVGLSLCIFICVCGVDRPTSPNQLKALAKGTNQFCHYLVFGFRKRFVENARHEEVAARWAIVNRNNNNQWRRRTRWIRAFG